MRRKIHLLIVALFLGCSEDRKSDQELSAKVLIDNGYKQWHEVNFLFKDNHDTIFLVGLNSKNIAISKSVFVPTNPNDSVLKSFFKKKGYISLTSDDSSKKKFLFNPKLNKLYEIHYWRTKVELSQKNCVYTLGDDF